MKSKSNLVTHNFMFYRVLEKTETPAAKAGATQMSSCTQLQGFQFWQLIDIGAGFTGVQLGFDGALHEQAAGW